MVICNHEFLLYNKQTYTKRINNKQTYAIFMKGQDRVKYLYNVIT